MAEGSGPKKTWVIVGASRGIGHEFVEQLLARGDRVIATVRGNTSTFWPEQKDQCTVLNCDVATDKAINTFVEQLSEIRDLKVDYVIVNAGVMLYPNRSTEICFDDFVFHLNTNTVGPIIVAQRLLQTNIPIGTIVFVSSDSGSSQDFRAMEDGFAAYSASKAALNMAARHMHMELERKGRKTSILCLHPGEVKTDLANIEIEWEIEGGEMTPKQSVSQCIETIESKTYEDSGTFWRWNNTTQPW